MPKNDERETRKANPTQKVNEYLAEESADAEEVDRVNDLVEETSSVTKILSALAEVVGVEQGDEIGAQLIRDFRIKWAAHELETL